MLDWGNGLGLKLLAAKHEDLSLDPKIHERCGVWEASVTDNTGEEVRQDHWDLLAISPTKQQPA